jgi:hypothetical protein
MDHLERVGIDFVSAENEGAKTILDHMKMRFSKYLSTKDDLDSFQESAKKGSDLDRRSFIIRRGVVKPNAVVFVPSGCLVLERTVEAQTVSGLRVNFVEKSFNGVRNLKAMMQCQKPLASDPNADKSSELLARFWSHLEGPLEITTLPPSSKPAPAPAGGDAVGAAS